MNASASGGGDSGAEVLPAGLGAFSLGAAPGALGTAPGAGHRRGFWERAAESRALGSWERWLFVALWELWTFQLGTGGFAMRPVKSKAIFAEGCSKPRFFYEQRSG